LVKERRIVYSLALKGGTIFPEGGGGVLAKACLKKHQESEGQESGGDS
jgi:hypothetical protein